jgi:thymidine phosphorylase
VASGELLYRIHAEFATDLEFAKQAAFKQSAYTIGTLQELPHVFVEF